MPPSKHAVLSASSSHRWLNCPPAARLELEFEDRESEAAAEGTAAHALCEHKLRRALKRIVVGHFDSPFSLAAASSACMASFLRTSCQPEFTSRLRVTFVWEFQKAR